MDKYEYNLKLDQMKSRYAEEKYDEAADIADTINWNTALFLILRQEFPVLLHVSDEAV